MKLFFKGFAAGFKEFGHSISKTINVVTLLFVFIFGIGLVALFSKVGRKKFLPMTHPEKDGSYWADKASTNKTKEESLRPF